MLLLLLVFPLLTLIISSQYFIYPFIVSKGTLPYIYIITADSCVAQVSRLILNLLEANCPLDESIDSRTMETLRFCHLESNRDTEADISQSEGGGCFVEEMHEGTRWAFGVVNPSRWCRMSPCGWPYLCKRKSSTALIILIFCALKLDQSWWLVLLMHWSGRI